MSILAKKNVIIVSLLVVFATTTLRLSLKNRENESFLLRQDTRASSSDTAKNSRVLNIHIVPHSHDDVGWLKTVDQYFYGLNQSIQRASVNDILDSIIGALLENPSRTFTYVEQKYFSMWWEQQKEAVKDSVRFLVKNEQLNFVNGGWCMHDEATTHFLGMIDQTSLGHSFLKRELGYIPKVGWQLDPFGHSASQATLMTSRMGFDSIFFGRIDYQDLKLRQSNEDCEGLWNASQSLHDTTVFWGLSGSNQGMYGAPRGFCYDFYCEDPLITEMNETTLLDSIQHFLQLMKSQSDQTRSNHIMLTMGEDFQYQRARINFANLDALISSVKRLQEWKLINVSGLLGPRFDSLSIFYSSPEYYTKCKYEEAKALHFNKTDASGDYRSGLGIKNDDFFPYSDRPHGFWTGYFTSRASFKRLERTASSFLLAARQIETYGNDVEYNHCKAAFNELEDALGIAQHHDGVSGTAKQHVANDYAKRLHSALARVSTCSTTKLRNVFFGENASNYLMDLSICQLNETICEVSQKATLEQNSTDVYVIVYNALGQLRSSVIMLPVSSASSYHVWKVGSPDTDSKTVQSIISPMAISNESSQYVLPLDTGELPPIGASIFRIKKTSNKISSPTNHDDLKMRMTRNKDGDVEYSNGLIRVVFDGSTGAVQRVETSEVTLNLSQEFGFYTSFDSKLDKHSSNDDQNSGAYIFRPSTPNQQLKTFKPSKVHFHNTSECMEVRIEYEEGWIHTIFRVLPDISHLEMEYTVGPIPIDDGRGKEVVTRFSSPMIQSQGVFFTDSNGREFLKRKRNFRPSWILNVTEPVAGNYFPVNAAIYVQDDSAALAVVTDRSQGGSSLQDGSIELMVHRRTLVDDHRGVNEALNETDGDMTPCPPYGNGTRYGEGLVVRGKHRILVGKRTGATLSRSVMDSAFADPLVLVGSDSGSGVLPFQVFNFSGIASSLPPNVMLLTRMPLYDEAEGTAFLIRLGHQYGIGEDGVLSQTVKVDLALCVPGFQITGIVERTLSGNQAFSSWKKSRLDWNFGLLKLKKGEHFGFVSSDSGTIVELMPMDIRTFKVNVKEVFSGDSVYGKELW